GEPALDPDFARKVKRYKSDAIVLFTPHLALNEAPRYAVENDDVNECFAVGWGVESTEDLEWQFADARARRLPSMPGGMSFAPTVLDPSQGPPGRHTAFVWQLTSYHLPWYERKEAFGEQLLARWREY